MKKQKIYIRGMHCPSCEKLLTGEFRNIPGVTDAEADWKAGTAEIFFEEKAPDIAVIKEVAKKYGYEVSGNRLENKESRKSGGFIWQDWLQAILIVLIILFLYRIIQNSGLINAINIKSSTVSFGIAFLIGLVASVSSCLAVVGAVIIAFSEKYQSSKKSFYEGAVKPNLYFHIGRLGTFLVLGGLLGAIGGELNVSGNFISIYTIIIAAVMGWLGLNILGILPSLSAVGIRMPKSFSSRWADLKRSEHKAAPFLLGGLSFFLPCGFTQSMQLFALASGSFLIGGLSLFLFALGTVPTLLALGITASWTRNKGFAVFQRVAGVLIVIFAVYTLNSGLALRGVKTNVISSNSKSKDSLIQNETPPAENQTPSQATVQTVAMNVTSGGFQPSVITIKQGIPVRWVINGESVSGCTNTIIIPSLSISKGLSLGENLVQFTPSKKGEIPFSCGMGMVRGKFIVQ